jgi:hypothetical protein
MALKKVPAEFEELLSPKGSRILKGTDRAVKGALADPRRKFLALSGVIDSRKAADLRDLIDRSLRDALVEMEDPIPEWTIRAMEQNYAELLPKTVRVSTAMLESRRAKSYRIAQEIGLVGMLRSASFRAFAEVLAGRPLKRGWGIQTLCYRPGDYTGPHNDHHPEEPEARDGYIDVHLTLATSSVQSHFLVYEKDDHFTEMHSVNTVGGMTAYRLPFWHYTTPLQARRRREADARRWVLLGTFLFADATPARGARDAE